LHNERELGAIKDRSWIEGNVITISQKHRKTVGQVWQDQHANHKDSNIEYNVCYEEAVVEMSNLLKMTMSEWRSHRRKIERPPREEREAMERCREES
jgi:hypothetical protein